MRTIRQMNGDFAVKVVRQHVSCLCCKTRRWKTVHGEQDGVDLQCRGCGRLGESKSMFFRGQVRSKPRSRLPGGSFAVQQRQKRQRHKVDLYLTLWDQDHNFYVRGVTAEDQPQDFIRARPIRTGPRAGYVLSDLQLSHLPPEVFPIVAERQPKPPI